MLELSTVDLEEIAAALQDRNGWDHCGLIDPQSGQIGFWTEDGGIDGRTPVDLDELDLIPIQPLPSWVWYRDMADFAEGVNDQRAGRILARAIEGKGVFRRFKDRLHHNYPELLPAWHAFQSIRAKRRAVQWLVDNSLVDQHVATAVLAHYAAPTCPEPRSAAPPTRSSATGPVQPSRCPDGPARRHPPTPDPRRPRPGT